MDVFVYGTLTDPDRAGTVLDEFAYRGPAELTGLHRVEGAYPTLAPGGTVMGRVLRTDDVAALDRYEGVDRGLYVRVSVPVADPGSSDALPDPNGPGTPAESDGPDTLVDPAGPATVETYVGDPDRLDAPAEWPGEGPFRERVRTYLDGNEVSVALVDDR